MKTNSPVHVRSLVMTGLFTAVILIMAFTPLGLIDLPLIKATILHVPVIIGSILLGPRKGAYFGFLFGLTSLWKNTMSPSLLSFAFSPLIPLPGESHGSPWALVICFVPRVLVGIVPYWAALGVQKLLGQKAAARGLSYALAGIAGTAVNTGLVMGTMGLVLGDAFAAAQGIAREAINGAILSVVLANGVPEAIAAAILTPVLCLALFKALRIGLEHQKQKEEKL